MRKFLVIGGLVVILSLAATYLAQPSNLATTQQTSSAPTKLNNPQQQGQLLSAFFGLDDALPFAANVLCLGAANKDGMPVVMSHTIDDTTLQPEDFRVITSAGVEHTPLCVTLRPASNEGELRTVLLIGNFGDAETDPPTKVLVVDDLLSDTATGEQVNFRGTQTAVIPLAHGPTLVWASIVPKQIWSQADRGSSCPTDTKQVVRVTWAGGVRLPNGDELGDAERTLYKVTIAQTNGETEEINPTDLGDLRDNDNNHLLCLNTSAVAKSVAFPAGHLVDPNGDLNPDSRIDISGK